MCRSIMRVYHVCGTTVTGDSANKEDKVPAFVEFIANRDQMWKV